jgi:hypothetical protein
MTFTFICQAYRQSNIDDFSFSQIRHYILCRLELRLYRRVYRVSVLLNWVGFGKIALTMVAIALHLGRESLVSSGPQQDVVVLRGSGTPLELMRKSCAC